jgi:hypothetical protein
MLPVCEQMNVQPGALLTKGVQCMPLEHSQDPIDELGRLYIYLVIRRFLAVATNLYKGAHRIRCGRMACVDDESSVSLQSVSATSQANS